MIFKIYSDMHIFSELTVGTFNELPHFRDEVIRQNAIYLGDNIDRKDCEQASLFTANAVLRRMIEVFEGRFVFGNCEVAGDSTPNYQVIDGICFTHGDIPLLGDKAKKLRKEALGQGFGGQKLITETFRMMFGVRLSHRDLVSLSLFAKERDCKKIVIGHKHPESIIERSFNGVQIFCLPRGITYLDL